MFGRASERDRAVATANCRQGALGRAAASAVALACLCLSAAAGEVAGEAGADSSEYRLGAGDRIRITVFGHEDLSGEFTLSESGTVSLPLAGTLDFAGVALDEAEQAIVAALKPDYLLDPRVGIEVVAYRRFYIIGEVNNPGAYEYVNGMTVNEAVALAGGFTYRARKGRVVVIRAGDDDRAEHSIQATEVVLPGDVVKVLERMF